MLIHEQLPNCEKKGEATLAEWARVPNHTGYNARRLVQYVQPVELVW